MTFEEYLMNRFVSDGNMDMDMFWDWLGDLPVENMIEFAEEWHQQEIK
jgi:hypothetical protein